MYEKTELNFTEAKQMLEQIRQNSRCASGYPGFDRLTGGLMKGGVTLIAGRPAMGKTSLALNIVSRLSRQQSGSILILSPASTTDRITARLFSIGTGMDISQLLDGSWTPEELEEKLGDFLYAKKSNIHIDTSSYPTLEHIRQRCSRMPGLRLLVVCNIRCIPKPDSCCDESVPWYKNCESCEDVLRFLRTLAKERNIPVLCTANLHRSLERRKDKRPRLGDLEKIGISPEMADQITFLHRDRYYDYTADPAAQWIPAGQEQDTLLLDWDPFSGRFAE